LTQAVLESTVWENRETKGNKEDKGIEESSGQATTSWAPTSRVEQDSQEKGKVNPG